jgi:hydrogenase/urease accessory protein HupE
MPTDVTLFGVAMTPIVLGLIMLAQQLGLSDYWADWARAIGFAALTLVGAYQTDIAAALPWFPDVFVNVMLALGVLLALKGAWPDMRSMWNRAVAGSDAMTRDFAASTVPRGAKYSEGRGRFW